MYIRQDCTPIQFFNIAHDKINEEYQHIVESYKFPNITVMDEFESIDGDDIVKGGVLREKVFKTVEDLVVLPKENPDKLSVGVCGTYAIHCVIE